MDCGRPVDNASPRGSRRRSANICRAREQAYFDQTVADIFGFHALQIGLPECPFLAQSRIASKWTLDYDPPADIIADPHGLPFAENTIDLIVMPHALEFTDDPHLMLREAWRVIRPEGQIVIAGFNPFSLFGIETLLRPRRDAAVERQFHRALPAEGLAVAARLRRRRRAPRLLRAAVHAGEMAAPLRRSSRRPATAGGRSPAASTTCARRRRCSGMRVLAPAWERRERRKKALAPARGARESLTTHRHHRRVGRHLHRRRVQGQPRARAAGARC